MASDAKILAKWRRAIKLDNRNMRAEVLELERLARAREQRFTIWLGGPGGANVLFRIRNLIRRLLREEGFDVVISEDYGGGTDIASKEWKEVAVLKDIIILAMSTGSSAEAVEFATNRDISTRLRVYIPEEYERGYVYKSLSSKRHNVLNNESDFSLKSSKRFSCELALKVLRGAVNDRVKAYLEKRRQPSDSLRAVSRLQ